MPPSPELMAEIRNQLQDDILSFEWLAQIARLEFPRQSERENVAAVMEAVTRLHEQGLIMVGEAKVVDEICMIEPWPESGQALCDRLETVTAAWPGPAAAMELETAEAEQLRFCFWIQWKKHADR
ncbi:MAG: hypothetical protein MK108_10250 [Mariniblastus sp.]|nr:hypothetical protein [Mariniblastus sp.]